MRKNNNERRCEIADRRVEAGNREEELRKQMRPTNVRYAGRKM